MRQLYFKLNDYFTINYEYVDYVDYLVYQNITVQVKCM